MVGSTLIRWQRSKLIIVAVTFFVTPLIKDKDKDKECFISIRDIPEFR